MRMLGVLLMTDDQRFNDVSSGSKSVTDLFDRSRKLQPEDQYLNLDQRGWD